MPWQRGYVAVQTVLSFVIEATRKRCEWCGVPIRGTGKYCSSCYRFNQKTACAWCGNYIVDTRRSSNGICAYCSRAEKKYRTGLRIIA